MQGLGTHTANSLRLAYLSSALCAHVRAFANMCAGCKAISHPHNLPDFAKGRTRSNSSRMWRKSPSGPPWGAHPEGVAEPVPRLVHDSDILSVCMAVDGEH